MVQKKITHSLLEAKDTLDTFLSNNPAQRIEEAAKLIVTTLQTGGKVISCGNGGSLCDASHFAEELTGRYRHNRNPFPAIAINDPAYITCTANDFSFEDVFARYVEAVGKPGDVLLAISTSGKSENVLRAARKANEMGIKVIGLTHDQPNELALESHLVLGSPKSMYSDRIQEIHIKIIHTLIEAIEYLINEK